jgi:hypothetical protein
MAKFRITPEEKKKIEEISAFNTRRRKVESDAKKDSVMAAKAAKLRGLDLIDQRREGNKAANVIRANEGNPSVRRGREYSNSSYPEPDKYHNPIAYGSGTGDVYIRSGKLEKEFPAVLKVKMKK